MDDVQESKTAAIYLAVVSYESPQNFVSPDDFRDIVLTTLQNGISFQTCNISSNIIDVSTCSDSMLLCCLSALDALFQYVEETDPCTSKSSDTSGYTNILKNSTAAPSPHQGHSEQKKNNSIWYMDAAKQLRLSSITELLVKYLVCGNKITSFLARKTILSGMRNQHIETLQVLNLLKQKWDADCHFSIPLIEIFRDMMSQKKSFDRKINCKTFNLLKETNLEKLVETQSGESKLNYFYADAGGLLEYISLLHKVIKYGIHSCEQTTSQDIFFIAELINNILFPLVDYFFTTAKGDNVYLICLESIKAINSFLDVRFLEEKLTFDDCILKISVNLQTKVVLYLQMAHKSNLLSGFNFVGTNLSSEDSVSISTLTRYLVLLAMKTFCVTLKGDCNCSIMSNLESLWSEVFCIMNCTKGQMTKDWLPVVFADQDDQWIITLFCLLIIHKELKKWQNNNKNLLLMDSNLATGEKCSLKNLQQTICPHKLFLQLVSFIDHDHLVIVDFLTSPETPFLSYFTKYLHVMSEDWHNFVLACLNEDIVLNKHRYSDSENSYLDKYPEHQQESSNASKSVITLPEFSAAENLPPCFVKISPEVSNSKNLPALQTSKDSSILNSEYVQNAKPVHCSDDYSAKVLEDPLQSSVAPFHDSVHLVSLSSNYLQTSSTDESSDCFYNLSVLSSDVLQNLSAMQSKNKQEHLVSQSFVYDRFADLNGGSICDRPQALVAYSDSDSEDCMEEKKTNVAAKKINMKKIPFSDSDSDDPCVEVAVQMNKNSSALHKSGENDTYCVFYHESTSDSITDEKMKCSNEVGNVLGMLIRLRLHIERLDESKLFPYNPKPLVLLLEACEELYEKSSGL